MHFYPDVPPSERPVHQAKTQPAWIDDYRAMMQRTGVSRFVAVQSFMFGFDNSAMLEAMEAFGDCVRGVAMFPLDTSLTALKSLHEKGIRGVRVFMLEDAVYDWDDLPALAKLIEPLGWHIQLQFDGRQLPALFDRLADIACPAIIDHNGKFLEPVTAQDPAFEALLRLLDRGNFWVKLSAPYETSRSGAPNYDDVSLLAKALVKHRPDRLVWATNFPHRGFYPPPDDTDLVKLLEQWAPDGETRRKILVDNAADFYGF